MAKRLAKPPLRHTYPLVSDIYEVVPLPFTEEVAVTSGSLVDPNSLRLVHKLGGTPPSFSTSPYRFSIPGTTLSEAQAFVVAMEGNVRWKIRKAQHNTMPLGQKPGRPLNFHFKLEYLCPCSGTHHPRVNTRKCHMKTIKCDCKARFIIIHHIESNTLRVDWYWDHNHNIYSHEDMLRTRSPKVVDHWLTRQVILGMGWKAIYRLLNSQTL